MNDFVSSSVAAGLVFDEFQDLPKGTKKKLIRLMARISEKSYRRGFQQGVVLSEARPDSIQPDLHAWRYDQSLDKSVGGDGMGILDKSIDRLFCENGALDDLGFMLTVNYEITIE